MSFSASKAVFKVGTLPTPSDCRERIAELSRFSDWRIYSQQPLVEPWPAFSDEVEPRFIWDDLHLVPLVDGKEVNDSIWLTVEVVRPVFSQPPRNEAERDRRWIYAYNFEDVDQEREAHYELIRQRDLGGLFFIDEKRFAEAIINALDLSQYDLFRAAYLWLTNVVTQAGSRADYANWVPSDIEELILDDLNSANSVLHSECFRYLARHPEHIPEIHPRKFESLVATILRLQGYEVQLTPASWDGGRDLIVLRKDNFGPIVTLVDCKRYRDGYKVGVRQVREIFGVVSFENAARGAIVTTSSFTNAARRLSTEQFGRLALIDGKQLAEWLLEVADWRIQDQPGLLRDRLR